MIDFSKVRVTKYTPGWFERALWFTHFLFKRIRIDLCFNEQWGYDVGCFCYEWKRSFGPFMLHRQSHDNHRTTAFVGPWRLMVAFTPAAFRGFDEAICK